MSLTATKPRERTRPAGKDAREYDLAPSAARTPRASGGGSSIRSTLTTLDPPVRQKSPVVAMVLLFLSAAGAFAYFAQRGHLVGEIASVALLPCALHGIWRGGFRKTVMLAVTMGLFYLVSAKPDFAAPLVSALGISSGAAGNFLAAGLLAAIAWITAYFVARRIHRRTIASNRIVGSLDRFGGTLIGAAEGALVVLSLCWCATSLRPYAENLVHASDTVAGSPKDRIGKYMLQIAQEADAGALGQLTKATNPLPQIPAMRKLIEQLNTTGSINVDSLDPATAKSLQGLLQKSGAANGLGLDAMLEQIKENSAARDAAYRQLPAALGRDKAPAK